MILNRLRFSNLPTFTYEIKPTEIVLKTSEASRLSTILGSNSNVITISGDSIKRIPHDFCLACMTDITEGRSILGLTPDIVYDDNSFIEIGTTKLNTLDSTIDTINQKYNKYQLLINQGFEFNIIAVSRSYVTCFDGSISKEHQDIITNAYNKGLNLLNEYELTYSVKSQDITSMLSLLPEGKIDYPRLDYPEIDKVPEPESFKQFSDYKIKFKDSTHIDLGSLIHLPWCEPSSSTNDFGCPTDDSSLMGRIWTSAILTWSNNIKEQTSFLALEHRSNTKKNLLLYKFKDQFREPLSNSDKVELAISGLWAKKLRNHPAIQTQRQKLKNGLNWNCPLNDIESFINSTRNVDQEAKALEFIDSIVRELILNSKRNLKRVGEFIVRKLTKYNAFVIIKPTRKGVDDDRPIFYSIACENPIILNDTVFMRWVDIGSGWYCTQFKSLTLKNCESLISVDCQLRAHYSLIQEEIGTYENDKTYLITMLTLMADSNEVSLLCQTLRYYYMELYSGVSTKLRAEKICSKFPFPIRNKLALFFVKKLISIHSDLPNRLEFDIKRDVDDETQQDDLPEVETPFGFIIRNSLLLLRASYMSMLKNKDAQNKGHDSKIILNKMMKWEYFRIDSKRLPTPKKISEFKEFQFSEELIYKSSRTYKMALCKSQSLTEQKFDDLILSKSVSRTKMADLASTKSSSIATLLSDHDQRSKVFIELLNKVEFSSAYLFGNINKLLDNWSWEDKSISLFKKNQIGGAREIYILPIELRLLVRSVEDISRTICEFDSNEKLTDHSGKDYFVDQHFMKVGKMTNSIIKTLKWSGDMSNWANLFQMRQFDIMCSVLFPKKLQGLYITISKILRDKKFWIPDALRSNFMKMISSELLTPEMTRFKNEFTSLNGETVLPDRRRFKMESNMMQGILHYTSSLFHLIYFNFIEEELKKAVKFEFIFSFEVSSDDEGVLITIGSDDESTIKTQMKELQSAFVKIKRIADLLFGVRTSHEKSTLTWRDIFEFNSKFFFGNCVRSPLIKFVARSVDDNPAETLRDRISSFHNNLRSLRENGCSGNLCFKISVEQKKNFERNLGSDMGWFDDDAKEVLGHFKLSYLGWFETPNEMTAGLVGVDYFDWLNATKSNLNMIAASKILPRAGLLLTDNINLRFDLWKTKKYKSIIRSLNINTNFTLTDLEITMTRPESSNVERRLIEIMALSPGVAKCFSRLDRNECVSLSAYLLYSNVFLNKSLSQIICECEELKEPLLSEEFLFPLRNQYIRIKALTEIERFKVPLDAPRRSRLSVFYPAVSRNLNLTSVKDLVSSMWFGKGKLDAYHYKKNLQTISELFPWFNIDPEVCLKNSPFESYLEMKAFIESLSKQDRAMRIISKANRIGDVFESLIEYDTYPGFRFTPTPSQFMEAKMNYNPSVSLMRFEGAFLKWQKLSPYITTDNSIMSEIMTAHLDSYCEIDKANIIPVIKSFTKMRSNFHCSLALVYGKISTEEFMNLNPSNFRFYEKVDRNTEIVIMKQESSIIRMVVQGSYVTEAVSTDIKMNWHQLLSKHNISFSCSIREGPIIMPKGDTSFDISKGIIRIRIGSALSSSICSPSAMGTIPYMIDTGDTELDDFLSVWFSYDKGKASGLISESVLRKSKAANIIREIIKQVYNRTVIIRLRERTLLIDDDDESRLEEIKEDQPMFDDSDVLGVLHDLAPDDEDEINLEDTIMESFAESGVSTFEADPTQLLNTSSELIFHIIATVKSIEEESKGLNDDMKRFLISCGVKLTIKVREMQLRRQLKLKSV